MADISKIKMPSGNVYDIKDAVARATAAGGLQFRGVTTTALTDEATTTTYTVSGANLTAANGDLVVYGSKEFVYSTVDNKWHELGDNTAFKALAYKDNASGTYKRTTAVSVSTNATTNKTATVATATITAQNPKTYTPAGSISGITWTGASTTSTGTYTPAGSITFTNGNTTTTVKTETITADKQKTYTPAGTVTAPTISVATPGSTTTIKNPTSVTVAKTVVATAPGNTAPSNVITYYDVNTETETLTLYQLGYTTGASITTSNVTVKDGDASYSASAPIFSGTDVRLITNNISVPTSASFSGTEATLSVSGTSAGSITNQGSFTGTDVRLVTGNIAVPNTYTATITEEDTTITVS